jgi:hypothetical protein
MKATKEQLYAAIQREREYQKQKYPDTGEKRDLYGYMIVAHEELREARSAFCKHVGNEEALRELLQVVAVGVAWYESTGWHDWQGVMELYASREHSLPCWLEMMENAFSQYRNDMAESLERARYAIDAGVGEAGRERMPGMQKSSAALVKIIAMGMRALMEHGVVEREEFSKER